MQIELSLISDKNVEYQFFEVVLDEESLSDIYQYHEKLWLNEIRSTILSYIDQSHSNIHVASAAYKERPKVYVSVIFTI